MSVEKSAVIDALRRIKGPDLHGNIVDLGLVSEIAVSGGKVMFSISVPAERAQELEQLRKAAETVVSGLSGVEGVVAVLTADAKAGGAMRQPAQQAPLATGVREHPRVALARQRGRMGDGAEQRATGAASVQATQTGQRQIASVPGVKHLVAVASGKGGVGKSTTAVNLALGFQSIGLKAGILDADIYGPSQPRLLGLKGKPEVAHGRVLKPMVGYGLKSMSMGYMVDEATPIVWRGPMVTSALNQMLREVLWADGGDALDVLVIDFPPGTGDVQLTMVQQSPIAGAVIVSTPQDLALIDARKSLEMFKKVDVPILGIIENMSYFLCPSCGERSDVFGTGGAEAEAKKLGVPFLGAVPLHMSIRAKSDSGEPVVATEPDSAYSAIYREIAAKTWDQIERAKGQVTPPPALEVSASGDALNAKFPDGRSFDFSAEYLRVLSPSAEVQGHSPEQRVTVPRKKNVKITELRPVGNYAVRIVFDDGHNTGLYTWGYLHLLGREKDKRWGQYLEELSSKGLTRV